MKKNNIIALVLNIISIACCIVGIFIVVKKGIGILEYYTQDSNILAAISSLFLVIFLLIKKNIEDIPIWVMLLRYISTTCLVLTFLVVVFVLAPSMSNGNILAALSRSLFSDSLMFHHFLCPILNFISFVFFEGDRRLNKKKTIYLALIPTMIYGTILLILNITKTVVGPYPFLMVYKQKWYMVVLWMIIIMAFDYTISRLILLWNQKRAPRVKRKQ